jgi:RimJ/RimL family protein N-acetyltransferase
LSTDIALREATIDDRMTLWSWYREPLRQIIFPTGQQVSRENHKKWWQAVETDPNAWIYIGLIDIIRIGCVRCHRDADDGVELFPYLKPAYHRQDLMAPFLSAVMELCADARAVSEFRLSVTSDNPRIADVLPVGARAARSDDGRRTTFHWMAEA